MENTKVYKNVLKMLESREINFVLKKIEMKDDYTLYTNNDILILFCKVLNKQMYLFFSSKLLLDKKGIIIYKNISKTTSIKLENISVFKESFFYFDRTKSIYSRKHQKVNSCPYEKDKLLKIFSHDVISRYYDYKKGDVILVDDIEYNVVI